MSLRNCRWLINITFTMIFIVVVFPGWAAAAPTRNSPPVTFPYQVSDGDQLWYLAKVYNTSVKAIQVANNLTSDMIYAGQLLVIPAGQPDFPGASGEFLYRVSSGDQLWYLARAYNTTVEVLMNTNHLATDQIFAGQTLVIPNHSSPAPASNPVQTPVPTPVPTPAPAPDDVYLLARLINAEAQGEPYLGQVAVGAVVVNRMRSGQFPNTIAGVILDPWQFEPVSNGQIWQEPSATALQAAREALAGSDPTGGALFFFNPVKVPSNYFWNRPLRTIIGNHYFFG